MSGAPAFSIVIPAYNYAHFLRRAVTSACTQDGADVEVLVVDDGSTDDTPAVMDKLSAEFGERLTYHRQPNQGPAAPSPAIWPATASASAGSRRGR